MARKVFKMKKQITKSYLGYLGITEVTRDGRVFTENGELKTYLQGRSKNNPYKQEKLVIVLHDSGKYKSVPKENRKDSSGLVNIKLHHVVYAWFHGEVPYGKQIHHIDGNCLNNSIDNLEALTPEEHRAKHAELKASNREIKCRLDVPRSWFEKKLEEFIKNNNYSAAYNTRARLRYYDSHIEEANKLNEFKKDLMELASWKKVFRENDNKKLWKECCKIEKIVKERDFEAWPIVKHALDVCHKHFGGENYNVQ